MANKGKGFTLSPTLHFCKDCGYASIVLIRFELSIIFYIRAYEENNQ